MISAEPTERIGLAVTRRLQQFLGTLALLFEIQAERRRAALGLGGACILRTIAPSLRLRPPIRQEGG